MESVKDDEVVLTAMEIHREDIPDIPEADRIGRVFFKSRAGNNAQGVIVEGRGVNYLRKVLFVNREWARYPTHHVFLPMDIDRAIEEYVNIAEATFQKSIIQEQVRQIKGTEEDEIFAARLLVKAPPYFGNLVKAWLSTCKCREYVGDCGLVYQNVSNLKKGVDVSYLAQFLTTILTMQIWYYDTITMEGRSPKEFPHLFEVQTGAPWSDELCEHFVNGTEKFWD